MEPLKDYTKAKLIGALVVLVVLAALVAWLSTPHQDSTEKPLPRPAEDALRQAAARATHRADSLQAIADSAAVRSRAFYAQGLEAGKQAAALRAETHQKPQPHAQAPLTPAATKQLQHFFDDY